MQKVLPAESPGAKAGLSGAEQGLIYPPDYVEKQTLKERGVPEVVSCFSRVAHFRCSPVFTFSFLL